MSKLKTTDAKWSAKNYGGEYGISLNLKYNYLDGVVGTPHGFVSVYSQGDEKYHYSSRFAFIYNGYVHSRLIQKRYTRIGLVRIARKYAKEIVSSYE